MFSRYRRRGYQRHGSYHDYHSRHSISHNRSSLDVINVTDFCLRSEREYEAWLSSPESEGKKEFEYGHLVGGVYLTRKFVKKEQGLQTPQEDCSIPLPLIE